MSRLQRILDKADELGMAVILGYFYFGQDERLHDETGVVRATDNATNWLLDRCLVGLLRLSHEGRRIRRGLPERAGQLGHQQRTEKRLFRVA